MSKVISVERSSSATSLRIWASVGLSKVLLLAAASIGLADEFSVVEADGAVEVRRGEQLFTRYVYADTPKPILYPIIGPTGVSMTRNYPMKKGVEGEATDHVHHRSLWFAHGDVNGVDFWLEGPKMGRIVHERIEQLESDVGGSSSQARITATANWRSPDGERVCHESRVMTFGADDTRRTIGIKITLSTGEQPLVFGDTKEGTMAMRVRPELRRSADPRRGGLERVFGRSVSSEGLYDDAVWGQPARWIDYYAEIKGETVGVAVFDHPGNLRHPTRWHARGYGLVTANPFGLHDFAGRPHDEGRFEVAAGGQITFRYLYVFHKGDPETAGIAQLYEQWAENE